MEGRLSTESKKAILCFILFCRGKEGSTSYRFSRESSVKQGYARPCMAMQDDVCVFFFSCFECCIQEALLTQIGINTDHIPPVLDL